MAMNHAEQLRLIYAHIAVQKAVSGESGFVRGGKPVAGAVEKWLSDIDHVAHVAEGSTVQIVSSPLHCGIYMIPDREIAPPSAIPIAPPAHAEMGDPGPAIERELKRLGGVEQVGGLGFVPMSTDAVAAFGETYLVALPPSLVWFAKRYGLARFVNRARFRYAPYLPGSNQRGESYLSVFYGGEPDEPPFHLGLSGMRRRYLQRMPATITPIGRDSFGNQVCVGVGGPEFGRVFFWEHDAELELDAYRQSDGTVPRDVLFSNVSLVADSFLQFLQRLHSERM